MLSWSSSSSSQSSTQLFLHLESKTQTVELLATSSAALSPYEIIRLSLLNITEVFAVTDSVTMIKRKSDFLLWNVKSYFSLSSHWYYIMIHDCLSVCVPVLLQFLFTGILRKLFFFFLERNWKLRISKNISSKGMSPWKIQGSYVLD